jgi:glycosyltransferase involved in cell wall biosynthesis
MKLFVIIDSLVKGGIERRMLELIKTLSKDKKYDIYLLTIDAKVDYDYVYDLPVKFEVINRRFKKDIFLYWKLYKKVKEFKPDIIHSWGSMSSVLLAPIAKLLGIKFINGSVGQAPVKVSILDKFYFRCVLTFPLSDAIVSNSMAGLKSYKAPLAKSYCIYNGMDFKRFENLTPPGEIKKELFGNENDKDFIVAMVAAFEIRKDYETYVKVAVKLCQKNKAIKFLLIGGGEKFEIIKSTVPPEYLNKRILFLGKRSDIESVMQIIDVGVLLTNSKVHGEGVSNSIIEYMASGKPVIATRGGGTDEAILDGKNGFLVDYEAADQIIEKIEVFYDKKKAELMGKNGWDIAHEKFDIIKVSQSYTDLYKSLLAKGR